MSILNESLSAWEIAFRWAGQDPDKLWIRLPLPVRDNFRLMMDAILQGHLSCLNLSLEKWHSERDGDPEDYIRYHLDAVNECIWGKKFDRKLLKWAVIERWAMQDWCERQGIPLPEFWFPKGWNSQYKWPDPDEDLAAEPEPTTTTTSRESPPAPASTTGSTLPPSPPAMPVDETESHRIKDQRIRRRIACQEVAIRLWREQPDTDVKVIANSREVQELAGGKDGDFDVLLRWLGEVDPRDPSKRRGPKRRK